MDSQHVDLAGSNAGTSSRAVAIIVPAAVAVALVALTAISAWPLLSPAREVGVVQAVFDRSLVSTDPSATPSPSRTAQQAVQAPGWLEAEPYYVAAAALADGVVATIDVLEGDYVEAGQTIATLVHDDAELSFRSAEADLAAARAAVAQASAELEAARQDWAEPVELERAVGSGLALLAESRAALAQLPALIESAEATLARLEEEAERVRRSTEQGATSELELITTQKQAAAQRAELAAVRAREPILIARVAQAESEVRAAERHLELRIDDRRRVHNAEAALELARARVRMSEVRRDEALLRLDRMTVRAPIAGYVMTRLKIPGDKVVQMMDSPHSAHLAHIYDPDRIQVRVDVPLADAAHVRVGQKCEVVVEVLPDRHFEGIVLRTTHEADLQKNTLQFKVKVVDPDPMLRPEMLTRVKFLPGDANDDGSTGAAEPVGRVLVPSASITSTPGGARVWLITQRRDQRGVLTPRSVRVIQETSGWSTIAGDIPPGALLAVGIESPREGERVVVRSEEIGGTNS
jgi:HlyD family secretion protein